MENYNYLNKINEGKTSTILDKSWFYHDFEGDLEVLANILAKGILCKKELGIQKNTNNSYNGLHYISLTKYSENEHSIFGSISSRPLIIISSEIKAIKTVNTLNNFSFLDIFINTPLPFRTSSHNDEWQAYKKIDPNHFIGIYFNLIKNLQYNTPTKQLEYLKKIVEYLDHFKLDIPIIDGADNRKLNKKVIRKIKIKS